MSRPGTGLFVVRVRVRAMAEDRPLTGYDRHGHAVSALIRAGDVGTPRDPVYWGQVIRCATEVVDPLLSLLGVSVSGDLRLRIARDLVAWKKRECLGS